MLIAIAMLLQILATCPLPLTWQRVPGLCRPGKIFLPALADRRETKCLPVPQQEPTSERIAEMRERRWLSQAGVSGRLHERLQLPQGWLPRRVGPKMEVAGSARCEEGTTALDALCAALRLFAVERCAHLASCVLRVRALRPCGSAPVFLRRSKRHMPHTEL